MKLTATLIKKCGTPITVSVGKHSFDVETGVLLHNEMSRRGCEVMTNPESYDLFHIEPKPNALTEYNEAYEFACFAWDMQEFDEVIER